MNFAVSDSDGVAHFTKQSKDKNAGFEGGSIKQSDPNPIISGTTGTGGSGNTAMEPILHRTLRSSASSTGSSSNQHNSPQSTYNTQSTYNLQQRRQLAVETEAVNMTSIDSFMRRSHITTIDIMKIDTEGNDNRVLNGAMTAIIKLGMFTFEGGKGVSFTKEMIETYDKMGFSCYSTSRAGLFKWNSNCMKEKYMGHFRNKDKGNIFCVNRYKAPMVTLAYDILSFPSMIEEVSSNNMGNENQKNFNEYIQNEEKMNQITGDLLVPVYLNIKPFCSPFPKCIKIES